MELEDLKQLWLEETELTLPKQSIDTSALRLLLKKRAESALSTIVRNMVFEGLFLLLTLGFCVGIILLKTDWLVRVMAGSSFFLLLPYAIFFTLGWMNIKHIQYRPASLKQRLQDLIGSIRQYINVYFKGIMVFSVLSGPLGFLIGFGTERNSSVVWNSLERYWNSLANPIWMVVIMGVIYLLIIGINYLITRWWIQKLYGTYLVELQKCLEELEEGAIEGA